MFQTGGKPSTLFPPVGLVELYDFEQSLERLLLFLFLIFNLENPKLFENSKFQIFQKFRFSERGYFKNIVFQEFKFKKWKRKNVNQMVSF